MKPKTVRRLTLLGVSGALVVLALVAFVLVRSWQKERRAARLHDEGMAAYKQADYPTTLDDLSGYLRLKPKDREAWLAFADAREKIEESGAKNLAQAAGLYKRAWDLDPHDAATGLKLIRLYNEINRSVEAKDLGLQLRPADPKSATAANLDAMKEEASARIALKLFDQTLDALTQRIAELDPDGYRSSILRGEYLLGAERKPDAAAFAESRAKGHPGDPRFEFLRQVLLLQSGQSTDPKQFIALLCGVAGLDVDSPRRIAEPKYTEIELSSQIVTSFDGLGTPLHALLVLKDADARLHDPFSRRLFARREWQAGLSAAYLTDLNVDAGPKGDHSELLAFKALALRDLGRRDEALAMLTALKARQRDYAASAWSKALSAALETTDQKQALALLDTAIKEHPAEPVFQYLRGETLWRLGRADEARQAWESVYKSVLAVGWVVPAVRIAETLLDDGRVEEGHRAAIAAAQRVRNNNIGNLVLLRASGAMIEAGRPLPNPVDTLKQIDDIEQRAAKTENAAFVAQVRHLTLPARVALLSQTGRKDEAKALLEQAIADPSKLDADLARRLAVVSLREGLGFESRVLATGTAKGGGSTLLSRALTLEAAGKRQDALALVDGALADASKAAPDTPPTQAGAPPVDPDAQRRNAAVVRAEFYDIIGHPDALKVWQSVVAAFPNSLPVHVTAIRGTAPTADAGFIDQLAAKITELGGSDPDHPNSDIRFARARAMLAKAPTARSRDDAVGILRTLVIESPGRLEFRDALINALLLDSPAQGIQPDRLAAMEQLTATAAVAPDRAPYTLRLTSLLQQQGRTDEAISKLSGLALDHAASPEGRTQAIDRLMSLRETDAALRATDDLLGDPNSPTADTDLLLRRASLLAALRRDREAVEMYRIILRRPALSADVIASIASALVSLGAAQDAEAALAKLDDPSIKPQDRALARAACAVAASDAKTALAEYTRATEAAPEDPRTWAALARFHLSRSELGPAEKAARDGLQHAPDDPQLSVALQQILLAGHDEATADLAPLAAALLKNPATARRGEAINAIAQSRKDGTFDDAAALSKLADEFADDSVTQIFVARRLSALKPPRLDEASRIIKRAAARFLNDATIQEQAAHILADAGQWDAALLAASGWRALSRQPEAALAVAEAQLALGNARAGLDAVRDIPLPASITDTDALPLGVLNVRVRAGVMLRDAAAFSLIQPYLSQSAIARTRIALPVGASLVPDPADVRTWIQAAAARMDPQSVDDQLAIASAWAAASERFPKAKKEFLDAALAVTTPLAARPDVPARILLAHSSLLSASGDSTGSIAACRQALAKEPRSDALLLRLAGLLLSSKGDPAEAVALCRQAVEIKPGPLTYLMLAQAQLAQAQRGDEPGRAAARQGAAEALKKFADTPGRSPGATSQAAGIAELLEDYPTAVKLYDQVLAAPGTLSGREVAIVKNNLAFALLSQTATPAKDSLLRAKSLIEEALRVVELAPFYETLGSINTALADRAGAIEAYRKALANDAHSADALIGLADLLSTGNVGERAEAAKHISEVEQSSPADSSVSASRRRQLQDAKQRLSGG